MEKLHPDFKDFLNLLNKHKVNYLLVGGYAVALHGYPRYTGDINFWIAQTERNAERLVAVFKEFGFDTPNLSTTLFLESNRMTRIGREPVKIEILNSISGVQFNEAYASKELVKVDDILIPLISLRDLRKNKLASGRNKDLADLDNLPNFDEKEQPDEG